MGTISVKGRHLCLGIRGPVGEALLRETWSSGTGVTTLQRRPDQSQGVEAYIHALGTNGNQKRSPPRGDKIEWYEGGGGGGGREPP